MVTYKSELADFVITRNWGTSILPHEVTLHSEFVELASHADSIETVARDACNSDVTVSSMASLYLYGMFYVLCEQGNLQLLTKFCNDVASASKNATHYHHLLELRVNLFMFALDRQEDMNEVWQAMAHLLFVGAAGDRERMELAELILLLRARQQIRLL